MNYLPRARRGICAAALVAAVLGVQCITPTALADTSKQGYTSARISLVQDGTGHGTPDQSRINSANGFVNGDDSARDRVVSTNDDVTYNLSINFEAGPEREVVVKLDPDKLSIVNNGVCVSGAGYAARLISAAECKFSIKAGAVGSIAGSVTARAGEKELGDTQLKLYVNDVQQLPAEKVTIVAAPFLDAQLYIDRRERIQYQGSQGRNKFFLQFNALRTPGHSPTMF